jgi:hypothetical protein
MDADTILRELVALKRLKDEARTTRSDPYYVTQADALEIEYERRKPAAWAAAFAWADKQAAPPAAQPAGCGFPYCGGNAPECKTCGNKRAPPAAQPDDAQDAARYRWLRHCLWKQQLVQPPVTRAWWWSVEFLSRLDSGGDLDVVTQGQELDAAIDEAMERQ